MSTEIITPSLDAIPPSDTFTKFEEVVQNALKRGLTIHPVKPRGKEPWLKAWQKNASKDPAVIAEWAKRFPTSNYGVAADDEFCILESDNFNELQARLGGEIPKTYTVQARDNRPHLYFRQTAASRAAGNLDLPGIFEFKQNNRYVVGEGSVHPTGVAYRGVNDAEIIPIPDWLVGELIKLKGGSGLKMSGPPPAPGRKYGEGEGRHPFLMSECAKLWDGKKTEEQMFDELNAINKQHCDPPQSDWKTLQQVQWIMKRDPVGHSGPTPTIGQRAQLSPETRAEKRSPFNFVLGPLQGEKHGVFAKGALHLIPGSSGNGKSTLGIQMLKAQRAGGKFFDREGYGREFLIVWQDRTEDELVRQLDNMGMLNDPPPYVIVSSDEIPAQALKRIYEESEVKPEILFVEGIDLWCEDSVDAKHVKPLARAVREIAVHYHLSIIATIGQPKMKVNKGYASPRDRIIGSSVWGRLTDTILEVMVDDETDLRQVQLLPRTGKRQRMTFEFKGGLLVPREAGIDVHITPVPVQSKKEQVFSVLRNAPQATKEALLAAYPDLADSTARNWVRQYQESLS